MTDSSERDAESLGSCDKLAPFDDRGRRWRVRYQARRARALAQTRRQMASVLAWTLAALNAGTVDAQSNASADAEANVGATTAEQRVPRDARATVLAWADAWSRQSVDEYLAFYSRRFQPRRAASRTAWEAERRARIEGPASISVRLENVHIMVKNDRTEVTFEQHYRSDRFADFVRKRITLAWEDGGWKIWAEDVIEDIATNR